MLKLHVLELLIRWQAACTSLHMCCACLSSPHVVCLRAEALCSWRLAAHGMVLMYCAQVSPGYSSQAAGSQAFRIRLAIPAQAQVDALALQDMKKPFTTPVASPLQAPAPQAHLFPDVTIAVSQQVRSRTPSR